MVPEKTRAAQDETSEEQRSGKTPVREGRRAQKGGEQPPRVRGRGARGQLRDARRFCAVVPGLNGVCGLGGLRAAVSVVCAHTQSDLC